MRYSKKINRHRRRRLSKKGAGITDDLGNLGNKARSGFQRGTSLVTNVAGEVGNHLGNAAHSVGDAFSSMGSKLKGKASQLTSRAGEGVQDIENKLGGRKRKSRKMKKRKHRKSRKHQRGGENDSSNDQKVERLNQSIDKLTTTMTKPNGFMDQVQSALKSTGDQLQNLNSTLGGVNQMINDSSNLPPMQQAKPLNDLLTGGRRRKRRSMKKKRKSRKRGGGYGGADNENEEQEMGEMTEAEAEPEAEPEAEEESEQGVEPESSVEEESEPVAKPASQGEKKCGVFGFLTGCKEQKDLDYEECQKTAQEQFKEAKSQCRAAYKNAGKQGGKKKRKTKKREKVKKIKKDK
jgi:hypothetical protein